MPLNKERQVINEQENAIGILNAMIILNEEQNTSNAVIPLNSEESTPNTKQLISGSSL